MEKVETGKQKQGKVPRSKERGIGCRGNQECEVFYFAKRMVKTNQGYLWIVLNEWWLCIDGK